MCPTGRTALPPPWPVHCLQEARSQGCAKGEEKQGNARVRLCHGRCPTGALRKYLRKLVAGLGRWVRAGDSVLIALLWAVVIFWPILEPTWQAPRSSELPVPPGADVSTRKAQMCCLSLSNTAEDAFISSLSPAAGQTPCQGSPCPLDSQHNFTDQPKSLLLS